MKEKVVANPLGYENLNRGKRSYKEYAAEAYPDRYYRHKVKEKQGKKMTEW